MSVENFDGNGFADQPSIVYAFESDDSGDVEVRELSRSGFGGVGPSPGDVIERETTTSDPNDSLSELELPGQSGLARDDCGEDIPAFACLGHDSEDSAGCGKPVYVGEPVQTQLANEIGLLRSSARSSEQPGNSKGI